MLPNTQVYLGVSRLSFSPFVFLLQFVFYSLLRALDAFSHTGISSSLSVSVDTQRIGRICRERQHSLRKMDELCSKQTFQGGLQWHKQKSISISCNN